MAILVNWKYLVKKTRITFPSYNIHTLVIHIYIFFFNFDTTSLIDICNRYTSIRVFFVIAQTNNCYLHLKLYIFLEGRSICCIFHIIFCCCSLNTVYLLEFVHNLFLISYIFSCICSHFALTVFLWKHFCYFVPQHDVIFKKKYYIIL